MNQALIKEIEELGFVVNPAPPQPFSMPTGLKLVSYGYVPIDCVVPVVECIVEEYSRGSVVALSEGGAMLVKPEPGVNIVGMYEVYAYNAWRGFNSVQLEVLFKPLGE